MRVRLVKVVTTATERTVARTMQPDFGGLIELLHPHAAPHAFIVPAAASREECT